MGAKQGSTIIVFKYFKCHARLMLSTLDAKQHYCLKSFMCKARPFSIILCPKQTSSNIFKARVLFNHFKFGCKAKLLFKTFGLKTKTFVKLLLVWSKTFVQMFVCKARLLLKYLSTGQDFCSNILGANHSFWPWLCKWWPRSYSILAVQSLTKGQHQPKAGKKIKTHKIGLLSDPHFVSVVLHQKWENSLFPVKRRIYVSMVYNDLTCP